jgi:hypothetical protein
VDVISRTRHIIPFPTAAAPLVTEIAAVERITNLYELLSVFSTITHSSVFHGNVSCNQANWGAVAPT